MSTSSSHIEFSRLVDLADGRLSVDERAALKAHLLGCQECSEVEGRLRQVLDLMRTDNSEFAPAAARSSVINMLQRPKESPSAIRRVLAALKFDSMGMSPAYGFRGDIEGERQLLFEAGETQLHLQVSERGEDWVITGQVLGTPSEGPSLGSSFGQVELTGESGSVRAILDEQREFSLPPVCEGRFTMLVRLEDIELEIPELKLGI